MFRDAAEHSGAFGLLLVEFPQVAAIYGELKVAIDKALEEESAQDPGKLESAPEVLEIHDRLINAFAEHWIIVPALRGRRRSESRPA